MTEPKDLHEAFKPFRAILWALDEAAKAGKITLDDDMAWVVVPQPGGVKLKWTVHDLRMLDYAVREATRVHTDELPSDLMDLLRRYRDAHRSMALVGQEAGAADVYKAVTAEVDAVLSGTAEQSRRREPDGWAVRYRGDYGSDWVAYSTKEDAHDAIGSLLEPASAEVVPVYLGTPPTVEPEDPRIPICGAPNPIKPDYPCQLPSYHSRHRAKGPWGGGSWLDEPPKEGA